MTLLRLRHVSSALARARRELGHGAQLGFSTRDEQGVLTLQPAQDDVGQSSPGGFFQSAAGVLHLTEPGAVLSLFGEAPVVVDGAAQAWYWQYINQMLSLIWQRSSPHWRRWRTPTLHCLTPWSVASMCAWAKSPCTPY